MLRFHPGSPVLKVEAKNANSFVDPALEFTTWNVASGASSGAIKLTNGTFNSNDMAFFTETSNSVTEKMRITSAGEVGIGTDNPGYALDVRSSVANKSARFRNSVGGDTLVRIIAGDYNTEIDARLFLGEDDTHGMTFEYDGSANVGYIGMNDSVDPTGAFSKRISMSRGGTEVVFPAGNVGIGTANPGDKLRVEGSIRTNSSGDGEVFFGTGSLNKIVLDGTDMEILERRFSCFYNNV